MGCLYYDNYQYEVAKEFIEKSYLLHYELFGETYEGTIMSLACLADIHFDLENHEKSLEIYKKLYSILLKENKTMNHILEHVSKKIEILSDNISENSL